MSLADRVRFAYVCPLAWDKLTGTAQERHCGTCQKVVTNLSAMPAADADRYLASETGAVCVRIEYDSAGRAIHTPALAAAAALAAFASAGLPGEAQQAPTGPACAQQETAWSIPELPSVPSLPALPSIPEVPMFATMGDMEMPPRVVEPPPEKRRPTMGKPAIRRPPPVEIPPPNFDTMGVVLPE